MSAVVHFSMAPMSTGLRVLTWSLFLLPAVLAWAGLSTPLPVRPILLGTAAFTLLLYATIPVFFRPRVFEIEGHVLTIRWLIRARTIDLRGADVARLDRAELRRRIGFGYRIGAGGLGGAFGLYKTADETFDLAVSTLDAWILLRPAEGRALLITPEHPERFVDVVRRAQER